MKKSLDDLRYKNINPSLKDNIYHGIILSKSKEVISKSMHLPKQECRKTWPLLHILAFYSQLLKYMQLANDFEKYTFGIPTSVRGLSA